MHSADMSDEELSLRENLYDFGYKIDTGEMPRPLYLKERATKQDRGNLLKILKIFRELTSFRRRSESIYFNFGVLAVGTSVYPDSYFVGLEKQLLKQGFKREEDLEEEAGSYEEQEIEFETYEDYVKWCNSPEAFDEKIIPVPKEIFNDRKKKNQLPYRIRKKIGSVLDRRGEDLDFIICPEEEYLEYEYGMRRLEKASDNFLEIMKCFGFPIKEESDYLAGAHYFDHDGKLTRFKPIDGGDPSKVASFRISFKDCRSFHFYFDHKNLTLKVREERIQGYPFCQLVRRRNIEDLEAAIKNGEEKGIFENPDYLTPMKAPEADASLTNIPLLSHLNSEETPF